MAAVSATVMAWLDGFGTARAGGTVGAGAPGIVGVGRAAGAGAGDVDAGGVDDVEDGTVDVESDGAVVDDKVPVSPAAPGDAASSNTLVVEGAVTRSSPPQPDGRNVPTASPRAMIDRQCRLILMCTLFSSHRR